jgi:hypothetical protein
LLQPSQGERVAPVYVAIKGTLNQPMAGPPSHSTNKRDSSHPREPMFLGD